MSRSQAGEPRGDQRWGTFLRNHAKAILAWDFFNRHRDLSTVVCFRARSSRLSPAGSLQRHGTADGGLDSTTA